MMLYILCSIAAISSLLFLFEVWDDLVDQTEIEDHDVFDQSPPAAKEK